MPQVLQPPPPNAIREELKKLVLADLLGPAGGPEEEVAESRVKDRYLVGMLAPRGWEPVPAEEQDELALGGSDSDQDGTTDLSALQMPTFFPSSCGMTFCVSGDTEALKITARWGQYDRIESQNLLNGGGGPARVWKRTPMEQIWNNVRLRTGNIGPLRVPTDYGEVRVRGIARKPKQEWMVSLFLVNEQTEPKKLKDSAWIYQPELIVEAVNGKPIFQKRPEGDSFTAGQASSEPEDRAMSMLYRNRVEFAVGHGVSVHAETSAADPCEALRLSTTFVPSFEVPQQTPPSQDEVSKLQGLVLDMKELAETEMAGFNQKLGALATAYAEWISRQETQVKHPDASLKPHASVAKEALRQCSRTLDRIREGLNLISTDEQAADAFRFANRAMWLQRIRSIYGERFRRSQDPNLELIDIPENRSWYPFQLAFILLNLLSLTNPNHPDRTDHTQAVADLLWFPTGGGKTEAYLGLAAYTMAIRRLQGTVAGHSGLHGVAVLMRYTLRLLTLQQFQRASTLICACEEIRREACAIGDTRWGDDPFRLGLWVGQRTTPNRTRDSAEAIKKDHGFYSGGSVGGGRGTPAQLTHCPWCGSRIDPGKDIVVEEVEDGRGRTLIYCPDKTFACPFTRKNSNGEGLPVLVVDEEIYRRLPALLISTVDKFAQMPWKGETQMLFGRVDGYCPRHGFRSPEIEDSDSHPKKGTFPAVKSVPLEPLRPPDLIIQDELHLISGPLGTLVGHYETAVDELAAWEVDGRMVRPKVIASTATIRRALDQVHSLFLRRVNVFPPQGIDIQDNFFSIQREPSEEYPGRCYLGVCAPGTRLKAALIRVYVALLSAGQSLFEKYGESADPWMTLVGYFNSLRELGGMVRLVDDDIRSRLRKMDERGLAKRLIHSHEELTSRKGAPDIPRILDLLETEFHPPISPAAKEKASSGDLKAPRPLDVLLATSMLSVGVDVRRLGLMVMAGQPKATAEYIQATSRIGRKKPGLVVTVYNWSRPRDMSHYETFEHYHATFYKHVEALSVTPFSFRTLDRGLTALLVSLTRLAGSEFNPNEAAASVDRHHDFVKRAVQAISARAERVLASKAIGAEVKKHLEYRLDLWLKEIENRRTAGSTLAYQARKPGTAKALLRKPDIGPWTPFTCLNSLREVEPNVSLVLDTEGIHDDPPA